jgi:hypothetical protein
MACCCELKTKFKIKGLRSSRSTVVFGGGHRVRDSCSAFVRERLKGARRERRRRGYRVKRQTNPAVVFFCIVSWRILRMGRRLKPTLLKNAAHLMARSRQSYLPGTACRAPTETRQRRRARAKHHESRPTLLGAQAGMPVLLKGPRRWKRRRGYPSTGECAPPRIFPAMAFS